MSHEAVKRKSELRKDNNDLKPKNIFRLKEYCKEITYFLSESFISSLEYCISLVRKPRKHVTCIYLDKNAVGEVLMTIKQAGHVFSVNTKIWFTYIF